MYQHKNSVKQAGTSHWNKLGLMYLPPARMKVAHLMTTWPNMQEARERFKKTRSLCVMWRLLEMFRNRKWLFLKSSSLSSEIHEYRPLTSCHALPADRRNKALESLECWLATLNASSAIMSHALEQMNAAPIGVIRQSASSKLPTCCLHGYSVS